MPEPALLDEHVQDWCEHEMSSCIGGCPPWGFCSSDTHLVAASDTLPSWPCTEALSALGYPTAEEWEAAEVAALDAHYGQEVKQ